MSPGSGTNVSALHGWFCCFMICLLHFLSDLCCVLNQILLHVCHGHLVPIGVKIIALYASFIIVEFGMHHINNIFALFRLILLIEIYAIGFLLVIFLLHYVVRLVIYIRFLATV
ncbi:hypothetical protein ACJX0J_038303 [Zea mays]